VRRLLPALGAVLVLSACTAEVDAPEVPSPFAACDGLSGEPAVGVHLSDLSLPCFTGDAEVRLRDLRGPTVINIWASWCAPCREELPVMQGLADRADGRYTVIGVDSGDRRSAAADFATDRGVTFPTLFDEGKEFADSLGIATLPATVFIDADGGMNVHRTAMDVDQLIEQMKKYTGVTVTR
jgi:cytochrome c biogenesis protein CcmG/thiol:disulfide interchange protein DsbE